MKLKVPYKNIGQACHYIREQIIDSLPYAAENFPKFNSLDDLFRYMKQCTTYRRDGEGRELLQSLETGFEDNVHGLPGAGDCDCFTIWLLALMHVNGFEEKGFVLVGRKKSHPVHIYAYGVDEYGTRILDLTNNRIDVERPYKYRQFVPL